LNRISQLASLSSTLGNKFRALPFYYAMLIWHDLSGLSHIGYEDVASVLLGFFVAAGS
jgi:hypothetical protein